MSNCGNPYAARPPEVPDFGFWSDFGSVLGSGCGLGLGLGLGSLKRLSSKVVRCFYNLA